MPQIAQSIKDKIERIGTPLKEWNVKICRGVLTGYNDAFIIDLSTRNELIAADPKSAEIIRPILRGRDIKRYTCEFANLWIIATHNGLPSQNIPPIDIEKYPAVKAYLNQYLPQLKKRLDQGISPYNLRSCAYMDDFSKQKIVWGEISDKPKFALDETGEFFTEATTFLMTGEVVKYLLGFLNSTLSEYFFSKIGTTTGVGTVRWKKFKIEVLPIPRLPLNLQQDFISLVSDILTAKQNHINSESLEKSLDDMIYISFNLSADEIEFIQAFHRN